MSRIRIGSFNVRNLADGEGRDLDRIAKMINYYHLDIVALQEVLAEGKVIGGIDLKEPSGQAKAYDRSLKRRLSGPWDSQWAQPVLSRENEPFRGEDRRGEGYAILWRTDKFDLPLGRWGEPYRPEILSNYNPVIAESQLRLIRDPLYARFLLKDPDSETQKQLKEKMEKIIGAAKGHIIKDAANAAIYLRTEKLFDIYFENSKMTGATKYLVKQKAVAVIDDKTNRDCDLILTIDGVVIVNQNRISDEKISYDAIKFDSEAGTDRLTTSYRDICDNAAIDLKELYALMQELDKLA